VPTDTTAPTTTTADAAGGVLWSVVAAMAIAVIVGGLAGAGLAVAGSRHTASSQVEAPGPRPADPDGFLEAWAASRAATFRLEGAIVRSRGDAHLELPVVLVERPPDHLRIQGATIEARLGDRVTSCGAVPGSTGTCRVDQVDPPAPQQLVAAQVDAMARLVSGPDASYRVVADGPGCWSLGLLGGDPAPPLGIKARYCFDPVTGAVVGRTVDRGGGIVETLRVDRLTATVTDEDLVLEDLVLPAG
jgi:hypothetical protein